MKKFNNKSGFTLIEIIVVLIIVGILAAIALPNLFSNVKKSRAEEALSTISSWRPNMTACLEKYASAENTCIASFVGMPANTTCFGYALTTVPTVAAPGYGITASTLAACGFTAGSGTIVMTAASATGAVTCTGAGDMQGAC